MNNQSHLRELLVEQFEGRHAHVLFSEATEELKLDDVGIRPHGLPHSIWELAEHIRRGQYDILDFCRNPNYEAPNWPDEYWPSSPQAESMQQWNDTLRAFKDDHQAMAKIIKNPENDLLSPLEHGSGQSLFREAMLIVDHNAYHIGQIIQLRRLLSLWH